jgi:hypothetical protein
MPAASVPEAPGPGRRRTGDDPTRQQHAPPTTATIGSGMSTEPKTSERATNE